MNSVQIGTAGQLEFVKLLILGSDGKIEASWPVTDDERRDLETHVHGHFGRSIAFQVKCSARKDARGMLAISFHVAKTRLITHPLFWYCFAYLNPKLMAFADPLYLVPSSEVHAHAAPRQRGDAWRFSFHANLTGRARGGRWQPFRLAPQDAGRRVLEIFRGLPQKPAATLTAGAVRLSRLPDLLWIRSS